MESDDGRVTSATLGNLLKFKCRNSKGGRIAFDLRLLYSSLSNTNSYFVIFLKFVLYKLNFLKHLFFAC
jgi:hypothetical protein